MSSLPPLCGHEDLKSRFRTAAAGGRLPQSLLLHGPDGIGKQRLGWWIAAMVLCKAVDTERPCGTCSSCRMVANLHHPDFHWFFPLPSPPGSHSPAKKRELLEDARQESLDARRESPLGVDSEEASAAIYLPMVEEIRSRATRRPAVASSSVFLVGDAERMVPQASSPEAANAFLKLLEEPPPDTLIILTSSRPGFLLPTIRSRALGVRVTAPDEDVVAEFLVDEAGIDPHLAGTLARRSQGAIGHALRLAEADPAQSEDGWRFVAAAVSGSASDRLALAASLPVTGARGAFSATLDRVEEVLRECLARAVGSAAFAWHSDPVDRLPGVSGIQTEGLLAALECVEEARRRAAGNGNPQAIAIVLLNDLAGAFHDRTPGVGTSRNRQGIGSLRG